MRRTKRLAYLVSGLILVASSLQIILPKQVSGLSGSDFNPGRIIDDAKFFAASPMSISDIQRFLDSKVPVCDTQGAQMYNATQTRAQYSATKGVSTPFICLKNYSGPATAKPAEVGLCNGYATESNQTAAATIYYVASSCGVNPQVLLVLLQKEQSLITDDWPWPIQYRSATGYGCPDTAPCDAEYYGFFNQVYAAARQFKRYVRDSASFSYRAYRNNYILYNPNAACGGTNVYIENQATAALYNYTPYQPNPSALANLYGSGDGCGAYGNRNFWRIFNDWFGTTYGPVDYSCKNGSNLASTPNGAAVMANQFSESGYPGLSVSLLNNTGSKCIEQHVWKAGEQSWLTNIATNRVTVNPSNNEIISGDTTGSNKDDLSFVNYQGTASGRIEVHTWDDSYQRWYTNIATNHPAVDPANARVISGDINGDGKDELMLVKYRNTGSGKVEVHVWNPGLQSWYTNIATNHPAVDPANARVISGDINGDGKDELMLVKYRNTGSGKVEVHVWNPGLQSWYTNIATNHPAVDPANATVVAYNRQGGPANELALVKYRNTGSGKVEVHVWNPGLQSWYTNIATNQAAL